MSKYTVIPVVYKSQIFLCVHTECENAKQAREYVKAHLRDLYSLTKYTFIDCLVFDGHINDLCDGLITREWIPSKEEKEKMKDIFPNFGKVTVPYRTHYGYYKDYKNGEKEIGVKLPKDWVQILGGNMEVGDQHYFPWGSEQAGKPIFKDIISIDVGKEFIKYLLVIRYMKGEEKENKVSFNVFSGEKIIVIEKGWEKVENGNVISGDKCWSLDANNFVLVGIEEIGYSINSFYCVIRKKKEEVKEVKAEVTKTNNKFKFNIGDGDKEVDIPSGWKVVVKGCVIKGDKVWAFAPDGFESSKNEIGQPVSRYYCVIRRMHKKKV